MISKTSDNLKKDNSACIACSISAKILSAAIIYETKQVICFLDQKPINPGHILICPKEHYVDFKDLPADIAIEIFLFAQKVATHIETEYQADGISLLQNNKAFNELQHYHLHVFPRYKSDNFKWVTGNAPVLSSTELYREKSLHFASFNSSFSSLSE